MIKTNGRQRISVSFRHLANRRFDISTSAVLSKHLNDTPHTTWCFVTLASFQITTETSPRAEYRIYISPQNKQPLWSHDEANTTQCACLRSSGLGDCANSTDTRQHKPHGAEPFLWSRQSLNCSSYFAIFYRTRRFITVFTGALHRSPS
jgi:hypothetical protein